MRGRSTRAPARPRRPAHGSAPRAAGPPSAWQSWALRDRQLDLGDVEAERLREADADLDILLQLLDVARAHHLADEGALLGSPERVLDERRQQPVRRVDEGGLRLLVGTAQQHLLVRHARAVVDAIVGGEPVAEVFEHGPARGAGDYPEARDDQPLLESLHLERLLFDIICRGPRG